MILSYQKEVPPSGSHNILLRKIFSFSTHYEMTVFQTMKIFSTLVLSKRVSKIFSFPESTEFITK